jgi:hypothetical protein
MQFVHLTKAQNMAPALRDVQHRRSLIREGVWRLKNSKLLETKTTSCVPNVCHLFKYDEYREYPDCSNNNKIMQLLLTQPNMKILVFCDVIR